MKAIILSSVLVLLSNLYMANIVYGEEDLYIGTFYGVNVSAKGWSSEGIMPAVRMALNHVNKDHSILPGYTLREDWRDSKCDSGVAIRAMLDLVTRSPTKVMFTAPGCSPAAEPIAEAASFWGAVQVGYSNTSPLLSDDSRFPLYSRTCPSETLSNKAIVTLLRKMQWNRVAIIVQQDHIFTKTKENLIFLLANKSVKIEFVESFDEDAKYTVLNIKNKDVRIIIGLMYEDKFIKVACEAYKQKIYGRKYVWILPGWYSENWWENSRDNFCLKPQVKEATGNYLATRPLQLGASTTPTIAGKTATELDKELKKLIQRHGYPDNAFSSFAYDAIWSIALTLQQASDILETRDKRLSNFSYGDKESAFLFRDILRNLSFNGMSGPVKFDERGDRETSIEILQQQGDERIIVSLYNKSTDKLDVSLLKWKGNRPNDGVIVRTQEHEDSIQHTIVILFLSVVGILFSFVCLTVNIGYRKHRIIKMSSPHFNTITAIGGFFCYVHVLLGAFKRSRVSAEEAMCLCKIRTYLIVTGFTFVFGGMFAKTWRVYKIFTNRRLERELTGLSTVQLMLGIICILLLDIVVLITWEAVDPIKSEAVNISIKVDPTQEDIEIHTTTQQCVSQHYTSWIVGMIIFKGIFLLFGVFLAWETRNVNYAELNDSKNIGVAVYNIFLFSGLSITAEFVLSNLEAKRIFNNSLIYLCTTMALGLVFIPKISRLIRRKKIEIEDSHHQTPSHHPSLPTLTSREINGLNK
ncbi:gamma-aminobutyric acid type B receptor subunit 2-like [Montipora capricornis]|uniref:gamma-aminobutyric acid type B receptor subunit 2-like n=1 Tax=Montipora capricornis TaxID=246305 RepID=UPI0035F164BB